MLHYISIFHHSNQNKTKSDTSKQSLKLLQLTFALKLQSYISIIHNKIHRSELKPDINLLAASERWIRHFAPKYDKLSPEFLRATTLHLEKNAPTTLGGGTGEPPCLTALLLN